MADLSDLPTQLTYELRVAISHDGPRAADWQDKPHRLVYDACREIERLDAERRYWQDVAEGLGYASVCEALEALSYVKDAGNDQA